MSQQNPNSYLARFKRNLKERWSEGDTPTSEKRFQPTLLVKDLFVFIIIPLGTVTCVKFCEKGLNTQPKKIRAENIQRINTTNLAKSQIIDFSQKNTSKGYFQKRPLGTLVKLKLLNMVETYSGAPVHAQVIDNSIGNEWRGATIIGEASGDSNYDRITIVFSKIKKNDQASGAASIKGRALSLDGTLGLEAKKKEGFFARSSFESASDATNGLKSESESSDLKQFLVRALAHGLLNEIGSATSVEKNRSQILTLKPGQVFFIELTDDFNSGAVDGK